MPVGVQLAAAVPASARLLGEKHRVGSLEIPEHEHEHFCLHLQVAGNPTLEWWWDGKHGIERPKSGSLMLLPPGTRDRLRWSGTSERYVISMEECYVASIGNELGWRKAPGFHTRWHFHDAPLELILADVAREASAGWPLGSLYADMLGIRLASALLRGQALEPVSFPSVAGGLPFRRLRSCLEFMTENLHRDMRLREIANIAGVSEFHFARAFRSAAGQTPYQYLLDQRIARAKWLLRTSELSVR